MFLARDFFGIKPMYYANMNGSFLFGSEIKAFLCHPNFVKKLNHDVLENYLTYQYSPSTETFLKGLCVFRRRIIWYMKTGRLR